MAHHHIAETFTPTVGDTIEQAGIVYTVEAVKPHDGGAQVILSTSPGSDLYRSVSTGGYHGQIRQYAPAWQRESRLAAL